MDSAMRGRLLVTVLLASALTACGSDTHTATNSSANPSLKTTSHKAPAVVLLPDTGNAAAANAEAQMLAKLGVGALVVRGPADAPTQAAAFDAAVAEALAAVKKLRAQPGVDPHRIGIVGEGVGAHVGAVAIGRAPTSVGAAVLADIGGVVVPSPKFAPERWLRRAVGIQLLFQRDTAKRAMTTTEVKDLMATAPPGTLMEQYKSLGAAAQTSRDAWIRQKLLAL
jgi:pimeloyl-ACP methyl ester carboxylesterase